MCFMFKIQSKYILLSIVFAFVSCAKRGTITGGAKDTLSPVLKMSLPKNFSTDFKGNEIKLNFDEYVKLKDVNKQLVVSPPMNTPPEILPTAASREITIKIKDTLQPNTTYSFNFGQSIQDNNEGNPFSQFKYVFSTGSSIDSLKIEGTIKDALEKKPDNFVTVMLYEINEKYNDSTVYKKKPRYVTNTLDSLKSWKIENVKAGKYLLIALKDFNNNFKFDTKTDKIGFYKEEILIPTTSKYELKLFKESPAFKALKPVQASGNRAIVGYEGNPKNCKIVLKNGNTILPTVITHFPKKDSLQVWFNKIKTDSLNLTVTNGNYNKNFTFKIKDEKRDTISFTATPTGILNPRDAFVLTSSIPIVKLDNSKISLRNKDSLSIPFTTEYDEFNQKINFKFKREEAQKYTFRMLPGAFVNFFEKANDTLNYKLDTRTTTEYGNLTLNLEHVKHFPVLVELTDEKGLVLASEYAESNPKVIFEGLEPAKFYLRIIYDENSNKQWDPGNFIAKRQAEEVIYFPKQIDVRANWDVEQPVDLAP